MSLQVEEAGGAIKVQLSPESLSEPAVHQTRRMLTRLAARPGVHRLRLDFSHVGLMTGSALGTLVALRRQVQAIGGELELTQLSPTHDEVLRITGLDRLLDVRGGLRVCCAAGA